MLQIGFDPLPKADIHRTQQVEWAPQPACLEDVEGSLRTEKAPAAEHAAEVLHPELIWLRTACQAAFDI